jgi:hypothetical protein
MVGILDNYRLSPPTDVGKIRTGRRKNIHKRDIIYSPSA